MCVWVCAAPSRIDDRRHKEFCSNRCHLPAFTRKITQWMLVMITSTPYETKNWHIVCDTKSFKFEFQVVCVCVRACVWVNASNSIFIYSIVSWCCLESIQNRLEVDLVLRSESVWFLMWSISTIRKEDNDSPRRKRKINVEPSHTKIECQCADLQVSSVRAKQKLNAKKDRKKKEEIESKRKQKRINTSVQTETVVQREWETERFLEFRVAKQESQRKQIDVSVHFRYFLKLNYSWFWWMGPW